jgi:hypothetical protein
MPVVTGA